ncbi:hypothetical protein D3C76_1036670 [compost metagenome]
MHSAIEDIEHRHGHSRGLVAAKVLEQRQVHGRSGCPGNGQADAQDGVSSEPGFISGSIQLNHQMIYLFLISCILAYQGLKYLGIHIAYGLQHSFAGIPLDILVTQLDCFVNACRRTGWNRCPTPSSGLQCDVDFYGWVTA